MPQPPCPIREKLLAQPNTWQTVKELMEHDTLTCHHCLLLSMEEKRGGRELLFANGMPDWFKKLTGSGVQNEDEEAQPGPSASNQKAGETKFKERKTTNKMAMTPDQIEEYLKEIARSSGDDKLLFEISKYKGITKNEAIPHLARIRKELKGGPMRKEQIVNAPKKLPWCATVNEIYPFGIFSKIPNDQQSRVLAMVTNLMNTGTFRHSKNADELKVFINLTQDERKELNYLVIDLMNLVEESGKNALFTVSSLINQDYEQVPRVKEALCPQTPFNTYYHMRHPFDWIVKECDRFQNSAVAHRWFKRQCLLRSAYSDSAKEIEWKSELESAPPARFTSPKFLTTFDSVIPPTIKMPDLTMKCELSVLLEIPKDKPPSIFEDSSIDENCLTSGCNFAMDCTTVCHLMSSTWESHLYNYDIPILVKPVTNQGIVQKMFIFGKPIPLGEVSRATVHRQALKQKLKMMFVTQHDAGKNEDKKQRQEQDQNSSGSEGGAELNASFDDPLAHILPNYKPAPASKAIKSPTRNDDEKCYLYNLFEFNNEKVLVRTRPAPHCKSVFPPRCVGENVSFEPRVEYFPSASAMCLSEEEWIWNYMKMIMKQANVHALFRIHFGNSNVLQLDSETINTTQTSEARVKMLTERTLRFATMLSELKEIDFGEYKMSNLNDGKLFIARAESDAPCQPNHQFELCPCNSPSRPRFSENFYGFEAKIPLRWQNVQGRAPGLLIAEDSPMWKSTSKINLTAARPRKAQQHKNAKKKNKPFNSKKKKGKNQNQQSQGKGQESGEEQMETEEQEDTNTAGTSGENAEARQNTSHQNSSGKKNHPRHEVKYGNVNFDYMDLDNPDAAAAGRNAGNQGGYASLPPPNQRGRGRGRSNRGNRGRGRGFHNSSRGSFNAGLSLRSPPRNRSDAPFTSTDSY